MSAIGRRAMATVAATLGGLALVAGSPAAPARGGPDVARIARAITREEDHVTAIELAEWIQSGKPGLRVIDVRAPGDLDRDDAGHIPGAERRSPEALVEPRFAESETLVLFSQGGAHAAQGWVLLRAAGVGRVFFLRDGLDAWREDVLHPTLSPAASPAEIADFARVAALSRFFGGAPRTGVEPPGPTPPPRAAPRLDEPSPARRRGC
jgi:rhodanese-related sulfurtransferase